MKTKLFLMSATLLAALSLTGVASADTTRDQIEAEGNQQIQAYWNEYQQALQDRQNAWEQSHGDIYTPAWQDANAHAGAAYREWLEARTALGDRLHAYDVAQWEKESDQPSNQTPVDDSLVGLNTEHSLGQLDLANLLAGHIINIRLKHDLRSPFLSLLRKPSGDFCRKPSAGSC